VDENQIFYVLGATLVLAIVLVLAFHEYYKRVRAKRAVKQEYLPPVSLIPIQPRRAVKPVARKCLRMAAHVVRTVAPVRQLDGHLWQNRQDDTLPGHLPFASHIRVTYYPTARGHLLIEFSDGHAVQALYRIGNLDEREGKSNRRRIEVINEGKDPVNLRLVSVPDSHTEEVVDTRGAIPPREWKRILAIHARARAALGERSRDRRLSA
jgi:hypothetical protein